MLYKLLDIVWSCIDKQPIPAQVLQPQRYKYKALTGGWSKDSLETINRSLGFACWSGVEVSFSIVDVS